MTRTSHTIQHLLLVASCLVLLTACGKEARQATQAQSDSFGFIALTGEVQSATSRNFGAPSVHKIWQYTIAYMAPDGQMVEEGQELLRFDTEELITSIREKSNTLNEKEKELQKQQILAREQLAELRLQVEQARSDAEKAALKADIPESLLASRDYRENQLLLKQARLAFELSEAAVQKEARVLATEAKILEREIDVLKAEIEELQGSVDAMSILAPTRGVVIHSLDRHGNKMAVGDNVWGSRTVVEFPDLSQLELRLEIPERDSAHVSIGQPVVFAMDAVPDKVFHGKVTELASVVHTKSINQPARVIDATIALLDPDPESMRPGMSVSAKIETGTVPVKEEDS